jgi:hypothetical protein
MSDEQQRPDIRRLWQSQADESTPMSLDDLRSRVSKMTSIARARAFVAGAALLIFVIFFGVALTWKASTLVTNSDIVITQCIFIIGAGLSAWQLLALIRRSRAKSLTEGEPRACAAFYRSELERRLTLYRHSAVWVPLAVSMVWVWSLLAIQQLRVIMIVVWVLFVPFGVYQNLASARRAQRELDELDAISGG